MKMILFYTALLYAVQCLSRVIRLLIYFSSLSLIFMIFINAAAEECCVFKLPYTRTYVDVVTKGKSSRHLEKCSALGPE